MFVLLLSLAACEPTDTFSGTGTSHDPVVAREVWGVSGGAGDLAWDGSGLLATAELGDAVLRWDPETDQDEEIGNRLDGSPTAVVVGDDGTIYVAVTDSGVEGFVGVLADLHTLDVLASSAGGALFRRPVDMVLDDQGDLIVADSGAEAIWRVPVDGGEAVALWTGVDVQALAWHDGALAVASDEGVKQDQDGALWTLSGEQVRGLVSWDGELLGTHQDGVIRVDDSTILVGLDAGRPAALTVVGDRLFVADDSGGRVWEADLGASGD